MEEQERYIEDDEIDLYELWEVLVKRKGLILGLFFAVIIMSLIYSLSLPKVYEVRASIMPHKMLLLSNSLITSSQEIINLPNNFSIASPQEIAKLLADRHYLSQVFSEKSIPKLKINVRRNVNIIDVVYDTSRPDEMVDKLKKFLSLVNKDELILEHPKKAISKFRNDILTERNALLEKIEIYKRKYKIVRDNLDQIEKEKIATRKQLNELLVKATKTTWLNPLKVIYYGESIRMLQDKIKNLSDEYAHYLDEETHITTTLTDLQENLKKNDYTLSLITKDLKNLKIFDILTEPYYMKTPVGPKKKLIVGVAGVSALFLAIFLAFFLEFLERGKKIHNH